MIDIALLADHPEVIPTLTQWFRHEWSDYYSGRTSEDIAQEFFEEANRKVLPVRLVAFVEGELVGTIALRDRAMWMLPETFPALGGLLVAEPFRRRGVATELAQAGMELARTLGHQELSATTHHARGVLERLGWEVERSFEHEGELLTLYRCELAA